MVGDSSGHREDSPSPGIDGRVPFRRKVGGCGTAASAGGGAGDPRVTIERAGKLGRLDPAQVKALSDLVSRTSLLGFESRRIVRVMVTNIALEEALDKRTELVVQLTEYLEGDGLAKDLVPAISRAFALR